MRPIFAVAAVLMIACLTAFDAAAAAPTGASRADEARNKPLRRCDQLTGKAELECLHKARERVLEARRKREASASTGDAAKK